MIVGDYVLKSALDGALLALKSDAQRCEQFIGSLKLYQPKLYEQAARWFGQKPVTVILGFPMEAPPPMGVVVAITMGSESETQKFIGGIGNYDVEYGIDEQEVLETDWNSALVQCQFHLTVYAVNANLAVWAAKAVWWALHTQRNALEAVGFTEQNLSAQDLGPAEQFEPDYVFRRLITFGAKFEAMTAQIYNNFLTDVEVQVIDDRAEGHPTLT